MSDRREVRRIGEDHLKGVYWRVKEDSLGRTTDEAAFALGSHDQVSVV